MHFDNFQSGDWQKFFYLLLILIVLASGLISRRDFAYAKVFKYLAIWSLVGFLFIILYSYRFEFSDFKDRILGEINPSSARLGEEGKLTINIAQDGHFYLNLNINEVPVLFMIDTGATDIVISKRDAARIGINLQELNFNRVYQTANGKSFGAFTTLDEVEISGMKFYQINASVNSADMGTSLLGMSFLRRFKRYEFYQDQLILEQ
jgi:aspartyl protease family protein